MTHISFCIAGLANSTDYPASENRVQAEEILKAEWFSQTAKIARYFTVKIAFSDCFIQSHTW